MPKTFCTPVGYEHVIDRIIVWLLVYLFATLPFAAIDFSPFLMVLNRFLLIIVGGLSAYSALSKRSFRIRLNGAFFILGIILIHSFISILITGKLEYGKETGILFSLVFIAMWARDIRVDVLAKAVIFVTLFYCADAMYQYINGVDLCGFTPQNNRFWGCFSFGAPTFGIFLSLVFFLPFFYLKRSWLRLVVVVMFALSMFIAGDRAPIVQTLLAMFIFMPSRHWQKLLVFGLVLIPMPFLIEMDPSTSNRVIAMLEGMKLFLFSEDSVALEEFVHSYGISAYLNIWSEVIGGWFTWDNLANVPFGAGWGSAPDAIASISRFGRPHNTHIEVLVIWGVVGYAAVLGWIIWLYRRNRETFVIFAPSILPFGFFSLVSSNHLFTMLISYILMVGASHGRQGLKVKTQEDEGARRVAMFTDSKRV